MTKQETYLLNKIFKNNAARELRYSKILHMIMSAKGTIEYSDVDQVGLINAITSLVEKNIILTWKTTVKNYWGDAHQESVWVYIKV